MEVAWRQTRNVCEIGDAYRLAQMRFDVIDDAPQPPGRQLPVTRRGLSGGRAVSGYEMMRQGQRHGFAIERLQAAIVSVQPGELRHHRQHEAILHVDRKSKRLNPS